jgi:uncharacterized cupredoxin-like copper-binding protein
MRRVSHMLIAFLFLILSPLITAAAATATATAQDASPGASPTAADCEAPPLPPGTPTPLEELMPEASPAAAPEATPAHDMAGMEMGTPVDAGASPEEAAAPSGPLAGEPADDETTARVTATVENIVACLNSGDGLAFAALTTPRYWEYSFDITNPYDMVYVMEGFPGITLISVGNVLTHDDGRYSAEIVQSFGGIQIDRIQALFIDQNGQLLLDEEISLPIEDADVTIDVTMVDFSFEMSESAIPSDATVAFDVTNDGMYPHEFAIVRLPEGVTVEQVLDDPSLEEDIQFIGGVFAEPGGSASFAVQNLEPGTYTVVCFVDVPDGIPHVMRGMVAELTVE